MIIVTKILVNVNMRVTTFFFQVGGLGDVLTGLSRSLQKKGHLVEAILPKYDCMDYSRIKNLKVCHDCPLYSCRLLYPSGTLQ